jgi:hypothetical protein
MSIGTRLRGRIARYQLQKLADGDLDAFEADEHALVAACEEAERAFEFARPDEAAARKAAYLELVELGRDRLARVRDERLAELADGPDRDRYRVEFAAAVLRRLSRFAPEIDPPAGDAFGSQLH